MTERHMQLEDWLDDLCVRFILNLPLADLGSIERICFQVEEAQWFYEDFIRPLDPALPSMSLRRFCERIFAHCPILSDFSQGEHMQAFEQFMEYKSRIPVRGAIMLNAAMDSAVLVKGWKKNANWSFPRGKINKDEDDLTCAIREVYEETGYNLHDAGLVPANRQVKSIEVNMRDQQMQLFVFRDVPMDTHFEPRTRKEISKIQWWRLSDLPAFRRKGQNEHAEAAVNANKFYMVAPFLVPLRKWVVEEKKRDAKRASSHQYLSAGMSHDELLTEEDRGAESSGPAPFDPSVSRGMPDRDSLEGASAALNRLLKIQQPVPELQAGSVPPPLTNNVGSALLALLHAKPSASHQPPPQNAPPHTPFDQTLGPAPIPPTPQHHPPQAPHLSNMPPPPSFPIQPQLDTFSYQQPNILYQHHSINHQQGNIQDQQTSRRTENPHSYQSQHLIHPQPLPPHVQRAVFTGGPVHAPMVPQPIREILAPQLSSTVSVAVSNPQFPSLHSPMLPPVPKKTPPKLTSHSLALLNAFKGRDQAVEESSIPNDLPLRRFAHEPAQPQRPQPQELPANAALQIKTNSGRGLIPGMSAPRQPISETQRSTLLGLFKSPTTQAAVPAPPLSATALPPSATPSAVELSAVEPLSTNAVSTSALLNDKRTPDHAANIQPPLQLHPEAQLPYRAVGILARPAELSEKEVSVQTRFAQKNQTPLKGKKPAPNARSQDPTKHHPETPEKPFHPQILKRPQPGTGLSKSPESSAPTQFTLPTLARPAFDQQGNKPTDHKQTLLSLFSKVSTTTDPLSTNTGSHGLISLPAVDPTLSVSARSRVGSLASGEGAPRRGSQTPISPANKDFLLNYLDAMTNGAHR